MGLIPSTHRLLPEVTLASSGWRKLLVEKGQRKRNCMPALKEWAVVGRTITGVHLPVVHTCKCPLSLLMMGNV